uniref:Uncharacterized protein n=1 Tax=Myoviridae sp. ctZ2t4 TaxID=2827693 RepID=A0A8S5SS02_9CAUD|nr:MAG TPA: hypothetical protein [Myoviridae sp. ctZ2t4]
MCIHSIHFFKRKVKFSLFIFNLLVKKSYL